jgi:hypothetical protein
MSYQLTLFYFLTGKNMYVFLLAQNSLRLTEIFKIMFNLKIIEYVRCKN